MHIHWIPLIVICNGLKKIYVAFYNSSGSAVIYMYMVFPVEMCDGSDPILFMPCFITPECPSYHSLLRIGSIQQFKIPMAICDGKSMKHWIGGSDGLINQVNSFEFHSNQMLAMISLYKGKISVRDEYKEKVIDQVSLCLRHSEHSWHICGPLPKLLVQFYICSKFQYFICKKVE